MNKQVKRQKRNVKYLVLALQQIQKRKAFEAFTTLKTVCQAPQWLREENLEEVGIGTEYITKAEQQRVYKELRALLATEEEVARATDLDEIQQRDKRQRLLRKYLGLIFRRTIQSGFEQWKTETKFTSLSTAHNFAVKGSTEELDQLRAASEVLRAKLGRVHA